MINTEMRRRVAPFGRCLHINYIILIGAGQVPCPERRNLYEEDEQHQRNL